MSTSRWTPATRGAGRAVTGLLTALLWLACTKDDQKPAGFDYAPYFSECPQDSVLIFIVQDTVAPAVDTITDIPLATRRDNLPEFHDCQQLVSGRQYGPLVGMFAADWLDTLPNVLKQVQNDAADASLAVAAVEIYNFGRAPYAELGIQPGFNCVYLHGSGPSWEAEMVPVGTDPAGCQQALDLSKVDGMELRVRPAKPPGTLQASDIPPVARWDWDSVNTMAYIGVKCGDRWCEIGRPDFEPSAGYTLSALAGSPAAKYASALQPMPGLSAASARESERVIAIKGWYDEQVLAVPVAGGLTLSGIKATIVPHPQLDRMTDFPAGTWVQSAFIYLHHEPGPYGAKLHLSKGLNQVWLCQGTKGECNVTDPTTPAACGSSPGGVWWQRIQPEVGLPGVHCVRRVEHGADGGVIPAGAARWRWLFDDEKTWIRCETGCCTVQ